MIVARHWVAPLVALAVTSSAAAQAKGGAKAASDSCTMTTDKPDELKDATSQLVFAQMGKADAQKKALMKAMEKLSRRADYYAANSSGHAFLLGEAFVLWSLQPGEPPVVKRGDLGLLGEKEQTIDLLKTADSAFTVVEKAMPACTDQTSVYRKMPWTRLINQVGSLLNADQLDSATATLDRSMVIYRNSPFTAYFQGQVAYRRDEYAKATGYFEKAYQMAAPEVAKDSSLAVIAEYSSFFAPYTGARAAAVLSDTAQKAAYRRVGALYTAYLKNYPCSNFAENAERGLFEALRTAGDTAAVRAQLQSMTVETKPCSDIWWYSAAREASDMGASALAVELADKAVAFSPWSAGLGNAAGAYFTAKAYAKLLPVAKRLTEVAPNSADNWQMLALAYQGLGEGAAPAVKKAYNDSLMTAYNSGEKLAVSVRITEFSSDGPKRTMGGQLGLVDNTPPPPAPSTASTKGGKGAKGAKPPPPPPPPPAAPKAQPKQVTVKVDFLDRSGAVVASQSKELMVNATEKTPFALSVENAKIVGYRYAPIP